MAEVTRPRHSFLAIDFETADYGRDSACAVGLARVEEGVVVRHVTYLIRPPRRHFVFTYIHGLSWDDVKEAPTFGQLWPKIKENFESVDFAVAHNASFDRGVLNICCQAAGVVPPEVSFRCTMRLARRLWGIRPTTLPDVCRHFGIALTHHDAGSDTLACARIMIHAVECGCLDS